MLEIYMGFETFVPGRPAAQGSKRHVGGGRLVEQSKAVAPWRTLVSWHVAQKWTEGPLDGPVRVVLMFVMPRPSSTSKRLTPPAVKRPDIDKMQRAILDALTAICWVDDSQVVDIHATKRLAEVDETPGCRIMVERAA
jgi:crossover junction endodeoxyribonuclease RusA